MFAALDRAWGGLDVLVNNAGIDGPRALAWEADPEAWERVLRVNLLGAFLCAREALKRMVAQRNGVVLNLTSVHEKIPWSGYSAYSAAKAGALHADQDDGAGGGALRRARARAGPGRHPHAHQPEPSGATRPAWPTCSPRSPSAGWASRRRSPGSRSSWSPTRPPTSPGSTVYADGAMTDYPDFAHGG